MTILRSTRPHDGITTLIPKKLYSVSFSVRLGSTSEPVTRLVFMGIFGDLYKAQKVYRMAEAMESEYRTDNQFRRITSADRLGLYRTDIASAYRKIEGGWEAYFYYNRYDCISLGVYPSRLEAGLAYEVAKLRKDEYRVEPYGEILGADEMKSDTIRFAQTAKFTQTVKDEVDRMVKVIGCMVNA